MKTLLQGGRIYDPARGFVPESLLIEDGLILAVGRDCEGILADEVLELNGKRVTPGLVDIHSHGRAGYDFSTATAEEVDLLWISYALSGVTMVWTALGSGTPEEWMASVEAIEQCGFDGIHLEGRYLNPSKRGAHPVHLLSALDAEELKKILDRIHIPCHLTAAFELDEDGSFARAALERGATLGLGHTAATAEEARRLLERGVTAFSHLYNAMPPLHHREGGCVSVALTSNAFCELIVDGYHVCAEMVALAYRCAGRDRLVLISDSMEATGMPDGEYRIAGQPVRVQDAKAMTLDGAIAGSTLNLWEGVKNLMRFAGISLEEALPCATLNPARAVGLDTLVGSLQAGKRADLLILDETDRIERVMARGSFLPKAPV